MEPRVEIAALCAAWRRSFARAHALTAPPYYHGVSEHLAILSFTAGGEHIKPRVPGSKRARANACAHGSVWECVRVV